MGGLRVDPLYQPTSAPPGFSFRRLLREWPLTFFWVGHLRPSSVPTEDVGNSERSHEAFTGCELGPGLTL